jgi:multidrug resistance efflux pump
VVTQEGAVANATAGLRVAAAYLDRVAALRRFNQVCAPLDGVLTEREVEVGTLVTAGRALGRISRMESGPKTEPI